MKWEYLVVGRHFLPYHDIEKSLNEYGKDRWELVGCDREKYLFKRPKK